MKKININQKKFSKFFSFLVKGFVGMSLLLGVGGGVSANTITSYTYNHINPLTSQPGQYISSRGRIADCRVGSFQPNPRQNSCELSSPGNYAMFNGMSSQSSCPAGTYQNLSGQSSCKLSGIGEYTNNSTGNTGVLSCTKPENSYFVDNLEGYYNFNRYISNGSLIENFYRINFSDLERYPNTVTYNFTHDYNFKVALNNKGIGLSTNSCPWECNDGFEKSGNSCKIKIKDRFNVNNIRDGYYFEWDNTGLDGTWKKVPVGHQNDLTDSTKIEVCPEGTYQDSEGQKFCKNINPTEKGVVINSYKTGIISCNETDYIKPLNSYYLEAGSCEFTCNEGWADSENGEKCSVCASNFYDYEGSCISSDDYFAIKIGIFDKFLTDNPIDFSQINSLQGFYNLKNTEIYSFETKKQEINNFFGDSRFKEFNSVKDLNTGIEDFVYTEKINSLLNDYKTLLNSYSGSLVQLGNFKNQYDSIVSEFNNYKNPSDASGTVSDFNFEENELEIENIKGYIGNYVANSDSILGDILNKENEINSKGIEISSFNSGFTNYKKSINTILSDNFLQRKLNYKNSDEVNLTSYNNSISDFESKKRKIEEYLNLRQNISIPDFNLENFSSDILNYSGKILEIENLKTDLENFKKEVYASEFNLFDSNFNLLTKNVFDVNSLNSKISQYHEKIKNIISEIENLNNVSEQIESQYFVFDNYVKANPDDEIVRLEYLENLRKSLDKENLELSNEIYSSHEINFRDSEGNLKSDISQEVDYFINSQNIELSIFYSEDLDDLGTEYSESSRILKIKNLAKNKILSDFDKMQEQEEGFSLSLIQSSIGITDSSDIDSFKIGDDLFVTEESAKNNIQRVTVSSEQDFGKEITSKNKMVTDYAKNLSSTDGISKLKESQEKLNLLKKQSAFIKSMEDSLIKQGYVKGCEPMSSVIGDDGLKYAGPEGVIPCSKIEFKKVMEKQKQEIFSGLFELFGKYNGFFDTYKNNLIVSSYVNSNVLLNGNGDSNCKPGTVDMGNGCSDVKGIKTKGIAYGSDAGAVIMDPFGCYDIADPDLVKACRENNDGLRLTQSGSEILLQGIIYSPEVGAIKFGGISSDLDSAFETIESNHTYDIQTSNKTEEDRIALEIYDEIYSDNLISFEDGNGDFVSTGTIASNLDSIFTSNTDYSEKFDNLLLNPKFDESRISNIKQVIKNNFYAKLENLIDEENNLDYASSYVDKISEDYFGLNSLTELNSIEKDILQRIKYFGLDEFIDSNLVLNFPATATDFANKLRYLSSSVVYSYINSNYSSIETNLELHLVYLKKAEDMIIPLSQFGTGGLLSNIKDQNSVFLQYASTGSISSEIIEEKIKNVRFKIDSVRKYIDYISQQEENFLNLGKIEGCEPGVSQIIDGVIYNKDGILPCSKRYFEDEIEKERIEILDSLFELIAFYRNQINFYNANSKASLLAKGNVKISADGEFEVCREGTIKLGNGCVDLKNVKIKGIAYGSDAGPLILDPFKCSDEATIQLVNSCRNEKDGLRFVNESGKIKLKGIVYSPEVGAIKFGGISADSDVQFSNL